MKFSEELTIENKHRSRGWSDDMSGPAIEKRLQVVANLYRLWTTLKKAQPRKTAGDGPQISLTQIPSATAENQ